MPPFELKEPSDEPAPDKPGVTEGVRCRPTYDGQKWILQRCGTCKYRPVVSQKEIDEEAARVEADMKDATKRCLDGFDTDSDSGDDAAPGTGDARSVPPVIPHRRRPPRAERRRENAQSPRMQHVGESSAAAEARALLRRVCRRVRARLEVAAEDRGAAARRRVVRVAQVDVFERQLDLKGGSPELQVPTPTQRSRVLERHAGPRKRRPPDGQAARRALPPPGTPSPRRPSTLS